MNRDQVVPVVEAWDKPQLIVHRGVVPTAQGEFAMHLAERFAQISAVPDGEDSAGRSKLRLQTPDEVAERACAISMAMFKKMNELEWLMDAPRWEEMMAQQKEARERRAAKTP